MLLDMSVCIKFYEICMLCSKGQNEMLSGMKCLILRRHLRERGREREWEREKERESTVS